ncbi:Signal transduction histidine kinase [Halobacillus alkaliphilus]|uniref:histidine kinase n=1 Tax=Halobacillus alkaliphilus TaxID=396056 RepID=A0A1I2LML5_9BACI|nr:HAMP domain-containing sensor histidine kinase [Halobacillus alkaliphilus]SFF79778.1 Signal transduction histidine kinase [Halobacillus alkaliphilus]
MKLANKIHIYTTVLFAALLLLIIATIYFSSKNIMFNSDVEQARAEAEQILSGVGDNQGEAKASDLLRAYVPPGGMVEVVSPNGQPDVTVIGGSGELLAKQESEFHQGEVNKVQIINDTPYAFISIPIVWTNGEVAALQLTESMKATSDNLEVLGIVLVAVSILTVIPLFFSARLLSNLITRPITSLIQTMNDTQSSGRFQRIELPRKSKDELYQMTETFNQMMNQLEANYEKQESFVSNASHELKTPLTVIESYSSLLKRRGKEDEDLFNESIEAIHSETQRMRKLTQQMLLLAKQDEKWKLDMEVHSLTTILQSTANSFEKAYQREVSIEVVNEIELMTDQQKLKQLLYIFMDNARKYSEDQIDIRIKEAQGKAVIQITDHGIGISNDHLDKVFDRFYQVDEARSRKSEGLGLGLSLARELAQVLEADISLTSERGKGTTASILLPISQ